MSEMPIVITHLGRCPLCNGGLGSLASPPSGVHVSACPNCLHLIAVEQRGRAVLAGALPKGYLAANYPRETLAEIGEALERSAIEERAPWG